MPARPKLHLSGNPAADKLLSKDPLALLIGMVLDQQIPLEWAFTGPFELTQRLGESLDARRLAAMPEADLVAAFVARPALHRFPAAMARRAQEMCRLIVTEYGGDPSAIWRTATNGTELLQRVKKLPGFGEQKAKIFVALLGKQLGVQPDGWEESSRPYGEPGSLRSIADITSLETLQSVREHKRAMKAAAREAAGAPAKRSGAKKATTKKATTKQVAAKNTAPRKKAAAKKVAAKKTTTEKAPAKKAARARA